MTDYVRQYSFARSATVAMQQSKRLKVWLKANMPIRDTAKLPAHTSWRIY